MLPICQPPGEQQYERALFKQQLTSVELQAAGSCAEHRINLPSPLLSAASHPSYTMQLAARQTARAGSLWTSRAAGRPTVVARQRPSWTLKAQQQETSLQDSVEEGVNISGQCAPGATGPTWLVLTAKHRLLHLSYCVTRLCDIFCKTVACLCSTAARHTQ